MCRGYLDPCDIKIKAQRPHLCLKATFWVICQVLTPRRPFSGPFSPCWPLMLLGARREITTSRKYAIPTGLQNFMRLDRKWRKMAWFTRLFFGNFRGLWSVCSCAYSEERGWIACQSSLSEKERLYFWGTKSDIWPSQENRSKVQKKVSF